MEGYARNALDGLSLTQEEFEELQRAQSEPQMPTPAIIRGAELLRKLYPAKSPTPGAALAKAPEITDVAVEAFCSSYGTAMREAGFQWNLMAGSRERIREALAKAFAEIPFASLLERTAAETRERDAEIAAKHDPERDAKPLPKHLSSETWQEIRAERRGERIAAELISAAIRSEGQTHGK